MAISFRNTSFFSNIADGGFNYTAGVKGRDLQIGKPARGTKMYVKDLGQSGAEHFVTLTYNVTEAEMKNTLTRIDNLADGDSGQLVLTGFPTVSDCVIVGKPQTTEMVKSAKGYYFKIALVFLEK